MQDKKIIIYTDKYSEFSEQLRDWLKERNFEYEDKDVSVSANSDELFKVSEQYAVPVALVGTKVIIGFNESELKEALNP
jgi:arsenate reductase-like glutaredoxin family protein